MKWYHPPAGEHVRFFKNKQKKWPVITNLRVGQITWANNYNKRDSNNLCIICPFGWLKNNGVPLSSIAHRMSCQADTKSNSMVWPNCGSTLPLSLFWSLLQWDKANNVIFFHCCPIKTLTDACGCHTVYHPDTLPTQKNISTKGGKKKTFLKNAGRKHVGFSPHVIEHCQHRRCFRRICWVPDKEMTQWYDAHCWSLRIASVGSVGWRSSVFGQRFSAPFLFGSLYSLVTKLCNK